MDRHVRWSNSRWSSTRPRSPAVDFRNRQWHRAPGAHGRPYRRTKDPLAGRDRLGRGGRLPRPHRAGTKSIPAALRPNAVRDGDTQVSPAQAVVHQRTGANLLAVFIRTRPKDAAGPGIAVVLVPADANGVKADTKDAKMGREGASTATCACFVPIRAPARYSASSSTADSSRPPVSRSTGLSEHYRLKMRKNDSIGRTYVA